MKEKKEESNCNNIEKILNKNDEINNNIINENNNNNVNDELAPSKSLNTSSNKHFNKKKKNYNDISHEILKFEYSNFESSEEKFIPHFHKRQENIELYNINILDQNRFKFIISNNSNLFKNYLEYKNGDYSNILWEDILYIFYYCVEEYQCPICLESNMVCPIITYCGHIFCYPCFISYYKYYIEESINKKNPKCPLCSYKINLEEFNFKFCEIILCKNYKNKDKISLDLIMREKKSPTLYNLYNDSDLKIFKKEYISEMDKIPFEDNKFFEFSRIFSTDNEIMKNRLNKIKINLEKGLKEELEFYADERRVRAFNECVDNISSLIKEYEIIIEKNKNKLDINSKSFIPKSQKNEINEIDYKKYFLFYQENYGDIYFLHPYLYEILLDEYKKVENLPINIKGNILDIEIHQINRNNKFKYPYFSHLRMGSIIFFVDIDLGDLISNETKKKYNNIFKERAKYRRLLFNEEKKYMNFIKKKQIKENNENIVNYNLNYKNNEKNIEKNSIEKILDIKNEEENKNDDEENEKEETIEKKENLLTKLFISEENDKLEKEKEKEKEKIKEEEEKKNNLFKFNEEEFPELNNVSNITNTNKSFGSKKNKKKKKKYSEINEDIQLGIKEDEEVIKEGAKLNKNKKNK